MAKYINLNLKRCERVLLKAYQVQGGKLQIFGVCFFIGEVELRKNETGQ